jgi:bifunctional DNase/RNase
MWVHTPDGEGRRFDARPSDALAVALRTQPRPVILVAEDALVEYGPPPGAVSVDQLEDSG